MRLSLWLVLILAFSVGMGCAFIVRALYFDAKPAVRQTSEPTTKILVATRTIPGGVEITADLVVFQEVPLSEVPLMALTNFAQVYRRQAAYPIPADCPICEDLLLPRIEVATQTAFIPTGSQFVTLDVDHIRQGDKVFSPIKPLSTVLAADQRIDVWVVPHEETQGRFAKMKNEVLRTHAAQDLKNSGELVLESMAIHQIQRRSVADHTGSIKDSLVLLLNKNEEAKLTAAAKKGHIRILLHQNEATAQQPASGIDESGIDLAEQPQPQDIVFEVPAALEQPPMPKKLTSTPAPEIGDPPTEIVASLTSAPIPADTFDTTWSPSLRPAPNVAPLPAARELRNLDPPVNSVVESGLPENSLPVEEQTSIRNDAPVNSFIGLPKRVSPAERSLSQQPDLESQETAVGFPHVTHAIQFISPGHVASAQELAKRPEVTVVPLSPPSVVPMPPLLIEKTSVPTYSSPFELRRVYTVQPDGNSKESSESELSIPPRLWRSFDTSTQTK